MEHFERLKEGIIEFVHSGTALYFKLRDIFFEEAYRFDILSKLDI